MDSSSRRDVTSVSAMLTRHLMTMAWRNLWRNSRRTALTLASIAFGGFLAVLFTGFQDTSFARVIDRAARMGGGHVTFQDPDYQDAPTASRTVREVDELRAVALADPRVERAVVRISGQAMVATASGSYGAQFVACDPRQEDGHTLELMDRVSGGTFLEPGDERGIVIGERLAANLEVGVGGKVVYTMTNRNGEIVSGLGRVRGLLRTGAATIDAALVVLPLATAREMLGYADDEATQVAVFIKDARRAPSVAKSIGTGISSAVALTWRETQPELAGFIAMKVGGARLMEGVVLLVVAAGIFNTMFMSVMERTRELGILLAIGYTPGQLRALVFWESFWLALVGLCAGIMATSWPYAHLARTGLDVAAMTGTSGGMDAAGIPIDPVLPFGAFPENLVAIAGILFLTTLAAAVYPAWRAAHIEPVSSIKLV